MKKLIAVLLVALLAATLGACGKNETSSENPKIGILQFAPHASLDNCSEGAIAGLKEAGYENGKNCSIELINAMGEGETNNLAAQGFVSKKLDIIIAVATPSASAAYAAAKDAGIPVIFSAVSSPLGAGLVKDLNNPQSGCSGTSDTLPYDAQLALIRSFQPEAETIGILYTTSEPNSAAQLAEYEKRAPGMGFTIKAQGITDASEVSAGITSLVASGIDCLCNLTDNNVVNNFSVVLAVTDKAGIPCYGSEEEQVLQYGCVAAEGLDYFELGKKTGKMAAEVLQGADIMSMPVQIISESKPFYSSENMAKFGLKLPVEYENATDLSD